MSYEDGLSAEYRSFLDHQRHEAERKSAGPSVDQCFVSSTTAESIREEWEQQHKVATGNNPEVTSASAFSSPLSDETPAQPVETSDGQSDIEQVAENVSAPLPVRSGIPLPVKRRMVELFACFHTVTQVRQIVASEHGLALDARTVEAYDGSSRHCRIGARLRSLYDETRRHYIDSTKDVAIAHQAQRLRLIGKLVEKATNSKDYAAALKGLELAAKEMGGVLEGKSTVEHKGAVTHVHGTVEDMRMELGMRLQGIVDGGTLLAAPVDTVATTPTEGAATEGE